MAAYKLSKFGKIQSKLGPGEEIVAGAFGMPPGGVKRTMGGAVGGAVGALAAGAGKATAGTVELPRKFVLGLTNQRLLICKPDSFMGNPKDVIYGIPVADITSAGWGDSGKLSAQAVIALRDGNTLIVEAMKGRTKGWLEDLLSKLQPMLTA